MALKNTKRKLTGNAVVCCDGWTGKTKKFTTGMEPKINARIARDARGVCRIYCKRAKYKHWFELGRHADTDAAFERALAAGSVCWEPAIIDPGKLF